MENNDAFEKYLAYGLFCNGNPSETPCGQAIVVDSEGNEVDFE